MSLASIMKSEINIKQIAYLTGYAKSTVSKALNGSTEISDKTKNKIEEIAEKYNYKPHRAARSLKLKKTNTIGLIVPEFSNRYCANIMDGISELATKRGYKLVVYQSKNKIAAKSKIVGLLFDGSIDGLILITDERFAERCEINFVKKVSESPLPSIKFDFSIFHEKNTSPLITQTIGKEILDELLKKI